MAIKIVWSYSAKIDFDNIVNYIQDNWSDKIAQRFVLKVNKMVELISNNPYLFPISSKKYPNVHRCVVSKQTSLYYKVDKQYIELVAFFDVRQNPNKIRALK